MIGATIEHHRFQVTALKEPVNVGVRLPAPQAEREPPAAAPILIRLQGTGDLAPPPHATVIDVSHPANVGRIAMGQVGAALGRGLFATHQRIVVAAGPGGVAAAVWLASACKAAAVVIDGVAPDRDRRPWSPWEVAHAIRHDPHLLIPAAERNVYHRGPRWPCAEHWSGWEGIGQDQVLHRRITCLGGQRWGMRAAIREVAGPAGLLLWRQSPGRLAIRSRGVLRLSLHLGGHGLTLDGQTFREGSPEGWREFVRDPVSERWWMTPGDPLPGDGVHASQATVGEILAARPVWVVGTGIRPWSDADLREAEGLVGAEVVTDELFFRGGFSDREKVFCGDAEDNLAVRGFGIDPAPPPATQGQVIWRACSVAAGRPVVNCRWAEGPPPRREEIWLRLPPAAVTAGNRVLEFGANP